jgi:pyruvate, orthophosphate dikinase
MAETAEYPPSFGSGLQQPHANFEEVGNKGFNLMKMARIGLPVPPGFILGTSFCAAYLRERSLSPAVLGLMKSGVHELENATGFQFGGSRKPMLLSVRSGAAVSMPGMMETILDLGLCDSTIGGLVRLTGNPRFVWDSYRRLIQTYAEVVRGCPPGAFDKVARGYLAAERLENVRDLDTETLRNLTGDYLDAYSDETGSPFPQQPIEQLEGAVEAVFRSWESKRATEYRRLHAITGLPGTAVVIQLMVFGNMGGTSGSGVAFTRDPATGEDRLYIDFLFNAQGEDVVSGRHDLGNSEKLSQTLPAVFREIQMVRRRLESEFKDMQDFEFTVQEGKLYLLQCRRANRTPWAALRVAVDLVNEGVLDKESALKALEAYDLESINRTVISPKSGSSLLSSGTPASIGVAAGKIALDIHSAKVSDGQPRILVRRDISTDDIAALASCSGILTNVGGRTSHAAVVARQMNKVCIVACRALSISLETRSCAFDGKVLREGDYISLDGNTGNVYAGKVEVTTERPLKLLETIEGWKRRDGFLD